MLEVFEALSNALKARESAEESGDLTLSHHVLGDFFAHAPKLRTGIIPIPLPPLVFAAEENDVLVTADEPDGRDLVGEALLHWYREDINSNEHLRHLQLVYATAGDPMGPQDRPSLPVQMKARHGEIFVCMHKQMLAWHEAERVTADLPPVDAFRNFAASLGEGYYPNAREPKSLGHASRADDARIRRALSWHSRFRFRRQSRERSTRILQRRRDSFEPWR